MASSISLIAPTLLSSILDSMSQEDMLKDFGELFALIATWDASVPYPVLLDDPGTDGTGCIEPLRLILPHIPRSGGMISAPPMVDIPSTPVALEDVPRSPSTTVADDTDQRGKQDAHENESFHSSRSILANKNSGASVGRKRKLGSLEVENIDPASSGRRPQQRRV